jgi:four helix bundle protein
MKALHENQLFERKRFYEVARGSVIEIDAALEIVEDMGYIKKEKMEQLGFLMIKCFKIVCGLIDHAPLTIHQK